MLGAINSLDILAHPVVTVQCFGWRIFFRALFARQEETFLSLLNTTNIFDVSKQKSPELFDRIVHLELRAKHIYATFSKTFASNNSARQFFEVLALQEQEHAEMLELCRAATIRRGGKMKHLTSTSGCVSYLEQQMREIEELYAF